MDIAKMQAITRLMHKYGPRLAGAAQDRFFAKALTLFDQAVKDQPLPDVDTSKADARREALAKQQREQSRTGRSEDAQAQDKPRIKLVAKPPKAGDSRPVSPFAKIVERIDGSQWLYQTSVDGKVTVKQLGKYRIPKYVETLDDGKSSKDAEKGENNQPAKAEDKGEKKNMEKAQAEKFVSRFGRRKNFQDIAEDVAGVTLPEAPLQKSGIPFGKTALQHAMSQQEHSNLTGHQLAALRCGLPADHPGIENMDIDQMHRAAEQLRLDVANEGRARLGLPPLELPPESAGVVASWTSM